MAGSPEAIAFRDCMIDIVDDCRTLLDVDFCLRLYTVQTVKRTWSGAQLGLGTFSDEVTTFAPVPKVKEPTPYLLRTQAGTYEKGDRVVEKLSGTLDRDALTGGKLPANVEFFWLIEGEKYQVVGEPAERYVDWRVHLRRKNRTRVQ